MGFVQWFPIGDQKLVEDTVRDLKTLGCQFLRTGFSWADWEWDDRQGMTGKEWYAWLLPYVANEGIDILPNFLYVPLKKARLDASGERRTSHPPERLEDYGTFIEEAIEAYGDCFEYLEFFNEPHLRQEWNPDLDPDFEQYVALVRLASQTAHRMNKKTVLGGPTAHHFDWLQARAAQGILEHIDVVGFHAFPYCQWGAKHSDKPVEEYAHDLKKILRSYGFSGSVWLTETGFPTEGERGASEERQLEIYSSLAAQQEIERVYWWSLCDLNPDHKSYTETQIGFREESFYHFGIKAYDGKPKQLFSKLAKRDITLKPAV